MKTKTVYICNNCGYECAKWNGKCPDCGQWNTLEEGISAPVSKTPVRTTFSTNVKKLSELSTDEEIRYNTGIGELDRVLGGGLVKGSIVLLGGEPGIGKSTILLQICQYIGEKFSVLYISGEESGRQLKLRAQRLGVDTDNLSMLASTDAETVNDVICREKPDIVIIDSIQTMSISTLTSSPGSITQVRECSNLFMHTAKNLDIPIFLVGHVNKDGAIAGPKVMEHIVDAVLYFEGERNFAYRILRAVKNRFGSTNEIGVFEMLDKGLKEVTNPSAMLLAERPVGVSGSCVTCVMEGTRPILAEVQALATKSGFSTPKRTSSGFDFSKLSLILAVLEKRAGIYFSTLDVYLNVVGGFRLDEPAGDLAVALALQSSVFDKPVPEKLVAFGELGLGGEIRSVPHIVARVKEAERMGFETCVIPKYNLSLLEGINFKIKVIPAQSLKQAAYLINEKV